VLSYCEHIEFGMLACARRVADVDRFRELLAEESAILLGEDEAEAVVQEPVERPRQVPPSSEAHQPRRASPV
jgi:hypothetical protein